MKRHLPTIDQAVLRLDAVVYGDAELLTPDQFGIEPSTMDNVRARRM